jgi:N6-L-threonylcarbamoyladenine synthase
MEYWEKSRRKKMLTKDLMLGIDTSNYTTSVALTNHKGQIVRDERKMICVKPGEKGIRQSEGFFQHVKALPELMDHVLKDISRDRIAGVSVASRPRSVEGSYMPVFLAGQNIGSCMAVSLDVPFFTFSHQEGHIEAVKHYSEFEKEVKFLCLHLSGGTCEVLLVNSEKIEIIGGSLDISIGQLLDRIGVALGLSFPAGKELDQLALQSQPLEREILKYVKLDNLWFNLSGLETKALRNINDKELVREIFEKISDLLIRVIGRAIQETGVQKVILAGGVSSSEFIKMRVTEVFGSAIAFGPNDLSSDNAVGISLLGGHKLWR